MTLRFLSGSKNFCKILCASWEVFVLHGYDWIHWVAKSCTTTAYRWLFGDSHPSLSNQITTLFCTRYGSANASSAWGPCNFGPLVDLAISVFREVSINTVFYPNPHFSQAWAPKMVHEKNWRVSLCVQELYHPQDFLWALAAIPVCRNGMGLTFLGRDPHFYLVLGFWLA